ncbi:beta-glucosidase [Deinococcus reticulitermitis]|uniref:beta-glucosidase n=1 Tax=Deinococcus reticulitermitis TaxID=856736 RepID=A0A1H7C274_9DEIO|nr:glycoside hydrolase family 3 N-terminal domain-containing protein [Deinococcus reticulitermitis]SEJ83738.1 beta-glucosidase [Deinococcus reticulitermitis]
MTRPAPVRDDTAPRPDLEARAQALLAQMTLEEKIGQLWQVQPVELGAETPEGAPLPERPGLRDDIRAGRVGSLLNLADPALVNEYQRLAAEESRLGIPLLIGADVIHGFRTVFPIPLAEACTWNPPLLERAARAAALEASAVGIDWIFAPMVDVARDPRWGRIAEGSGEDVYLGGVLAAARVRGFQAADLETGRQVAACPKHYVGYGAAEAGRDYNTVDLSERTLREVHLPPFKAAFDAGAGTVMTAFNEIGGVPASANPFTLRRILREEWRWPGVTLSDYESVRELIPHGVAADLQDAARLSLTAGLDIEMVSRAYADHLPELVREGTVPEALVDEATLRVLMLKLRLGLFEQPYVDAARAEGFMGREETRDLALEVARQSAVLLKNGDGVLPLTPGAGRVALIGPLADARRALLGCWTLFGRAEEVETILEGVRQFAPDVAYVPGGTVRDADEGDFAEAVRAAEAADMVILVLGEDDQMSGEARSKTRPGLPGAQARLARAVLATGKPVVSVILSGRPLVIPELVEGSAAVLAAWHGGTRAGRAVAELLFGAASPGGRLTAGWPRHVGQLPMTYAHKNTGRPEGGPGAVQFGEPFTSRYTDSPNTPLFPFGHGLTYTRFEYGPVRVLTPEVELGGTVIIEAELTNVGERAGAEVAQLYVRDLVGSVTRPVRELRGFIRAELAPGERRTLRFEVPVSSLAFWRAEGSWGAEAGEFHVWIAPHSAAGAPGTFRVLGSAETEQ